MLTLLAPVAGAADFEVTVENLIPYLASPKPDTRTFAQQELQDLAVQASRPGAGSDRSRLAKALAARVAEEGIPRLARFGMVAALQLIGHGEAVDPLTRLLDGEDAELREWARRALEQNPSSAATASLRTALRQAADTNWTIGLIGSLGRRRDDGAVSLIAPHLASPGIASVAAWALGQIGGGSARQALWSAHEKKLPVAADGLLPIAGRMLRDGDGDEAEAIYRRLYEPGNPTAARVASLNGLARTDPAGSKDLILKALAEADVKLQRAAIAAAPAAFGPALTGALLPRYTNLPATARALVLGVLDTTAEPTVIEAAADKDPLVRLAALEALSRVGTLASVPTLIRAAASGSYFERAAADLALVRIPGDGASTDLIKQAGEGTPAARAAALRAVAARNPPGATPTLLRCAAEADPTISRPAFAALRTMATDADLSELTRLAVRYQHPEALAAVRDLTARTRDKGLAAQTLLAFTSAAPPPVLVVVLELLGSLGGKDALAEVSAQTASTNATVNAAAMRVLSNWPDFAAVPRLLEIARDPDAVLTNHVQAVRGFARLMLENTSRAPLARRMEMTLSALEAARRDEDRKQLIPVLATLPDFKVVDVVQKYLDEPALKSDAAWAGVALAEKLVDTDKERAKQLAQVCKVTEPSAELARRANAVLLK